MPCCCVTGCHNRAEKGHKLYKLPQGHKNETRRNVWIQNIGRTSPLPQHAYVCQAHFTDDQFELGRADHRRLLKWNAVPTIFSHCRTIECRNPSEQEVTVFTRHESSDLPEKATMEENLKTEFKIRTEIKESCKDNLGEVANLKCELNASLKEIHTLKTIIFQLQAIIEKLVKKNYLEKTTMEENLKTEVKIRTEVKESCKDNSDEVATLKCKLNASLKEIHTLKIIIFQLQAIIEKLVKKNCMEKATMEENLKTEFKIRTEVKESYKDNSDEVADLKCKLNASLKEIHTLKTIIFPLQAIIEKLVEENCMDKT